MKKQKKYYITTPIYYVNDKPHIGHAYTTVAADVMARWHRLLGDEVFFLTGTDEHGAKVAQSAEKAGKTPKEFCDENSAKFRQAFDILNIKYSYFIRTTDQRHKNAVAEFMQKLWDNKKIYEGRYEGMYCTGCEDFVTEKDLVNGKCPIHLKEPEKISEKNYFFKLEEYLPYVQRLIESGEIKINPPERKNEVLGLFKQGLKDFSVSREKVKWGIPLPFDKSQVTYVWVEALQNYISAIGYGDNPKEYKQWWPADLHLIGKDIIKFHAIYWPALLLAAGEKLPKEIFANGYFTINGQKMSKTLGNVIDPNDLVEKYGSDATRYLLLSQFPFGQDGDIKEEDFVKQYNSELANGIGNLVNRVITPVIVNNKGIIPSFHLENTFIKSDINIAWISSNGLSHSAWTFLNGHYNQLDLFGALMTIKNSIIIPSNKIIEKLKHWELWKTDKESWDKLMYTLLETIRHLGWMIRPFMPETSDKIFAQLGIPEEGKKLLDKKVMQWGGLQPGTKIQKGDQLFPRK